MARAEQQEQQVLDGMPRPSRIGSGSRRWMLAIGGDGVGVVTVHDGPSWPSGEIIGA